jgi:tryptophanyl-tRNA synthetase
MEKQPILFSGIKPTGRPHIGNYLGALKNWVNLQTNYQCIYSIVDYHALTIDIKPAELTANTISLAKTLLAIGIDPKKSIFFQQSHVPEHTELAWIFNCLTPVAEMERMTQYKDKAKTHKQNINMGLFDYPALMAADILLYKAEAVPVGEDQLQHLELTRIIAKKFNNRYQSYFKEPKALITKAKRVMSLSDPDKKMSKDLGENSYISLIDSPEQIRKKVMKAVTETSTDKSGKMSAGVANLIELLSHFDDQTACLEYKKLYDQGTIKYSELKTAVADTLITHLSPIAERYDSISDAEVIKILKQGSDQAELIAHQNLNEIKTLIGLL